MCLICYKPKGVDLPPRKVLKSNMKHNPDGTGFMVAFDGNVHICKGFFKYGHMRQELDKLLYKLGVTYKDVPIVIHSRIATSGKINRGNTHPFPLKPDESQLTKTEVVCPVGVAHNGVIWSTVGSLSDTQEFVRDILSRASFESIQNEDSAERKIIEEIISTDRLILMNGAGTVVMIGTWQEDHDLFWSNWSFKRSALTVCVAKEIEEPAQCNIYGVGWGVCEMCCKDTYLDKVRNTCVDLCHQCSCKVMEHISRRDIAFVTKKPHKGRCCACHIMGLVRWLNGEGYVCIRCYYVFCLNDKMVRKEIIKKINDEIVLPRIPFLEGEDGYQPC